MTPEQLIELCIILFLVGVGGMWLQRFLTKPVVPVQIAIPKEIAEQMLASGQPINIAFHAGPPPTPS